MTIPIVSAPVMRRLNVNGLDHLVRHYVAPDSKHPPVLVLHGFLDSGGTFDPVARALQAAGHEIFVPDLRGFGRTARIGAGGYYHFADYVTDVRCLLEVLNLGRAAVVGHSMGGGVASLFAGTFPDRVAKLALLEGIGPMGEAPDQAVLRMRKHQADLARVDRKPRQVASTAEALERLALTHPRISPEALQEQLQHLLAEGEDGALSWAWDPLHRTASATPFYSDAFASFLREIRCPTLFVSGGPSGWHPPEEEDRLALISTLARRELPDAGHMMHWTRPAELAEVLVEFLA